MGGFFNQKNAVILLQAGLSFAFLYAAVSAFLRPNDWVGYLPGFVDAVLLPNLLLNIFGILEVLLALWLLSGRKLFYSSLVAAMMLGGITITNLGILDVTFRDISLLLCAVALSCLSYKKS